MCTHNYTYSVGIMCIVYCTGELYEFANNTHSLELVILIVERFTSFDFLSVGRSHDFQIHMIITQQKALHTINVKVMAWTPELIIKNHSFSSYELYCFIVHDQGYKNHKKKL